jgi:hypothetical protein
MLMRRGEGRTKTQRHREDGDTGFGEWGRRIVMLKADAAEEAESAEERKRRDR